MRPGDLVCWPASWARGRRRSPKASPRARRRPSRHQSHVHARATLRRDGSRSTISTSIDSSSSSRCRSRPPRAARRRRRGRHRVGRCRHRRAARRLLRGTFRASATTTTIAHRASGRWHRLADARSRSLSETTVDVAMLILGIEIGDGAGRLRDRRSRRRDRLVRIDQGPAPRRDARARHRLRPAARRGSSSTRSASSPSTSVPALFTGLRVGLATAKAVAHALRVPMIGIPSLDLLAFPARYTSRLIVAVIDARRGEVFYALYRQVPGGVQRVSPISVGTPDDLAAELLALTATMSCSSATAPCATTRRSPTCAGSSSRSSGCRTRRRRSARAARPRPRPSRGLGQPLGSRAAVSAQARCRPSTGRPVREPGDERAAERADRSR